MLIKMNVTIEATPSRLQAVLAAIDAALAAPEPAQVEPAAQVEPIPAPPRQNSPTAAQRAALEAYRASLPKRTPPAPAAPRPAVTATIHPPARVDAPPTKEKPGRLLWDDIKDSDKLDRFVALGKARGWPPLIVNWSAGMVREARAACSA
jgi:hypothetical protein